MEFNKLTEMIYLCNIFLFQALFVQQINGQSLNLALGKLTTDTLQLNDTSYWAVDGRETCFIATNYDKQWLIVDLIWKYSIDNIVIFTNDTNNNLLSGVTDTMSSPFDSQETKFCRKDATSINQSMSYLCFNYVASHAFVAVLENSTNLFVVCELEVYGTWAEPVEERPNLLLGKWAYMPQTWSERTNSGTDYYSASRATDGIRDPNPRHGFCARTIDDIFFKIWLVVDMGNSYIIDYVALTQSRNLSDLNAMLNIVIGLSHVKSPVNIEQYPLCANPIASLSSLGRRDIIKCSATLPAYRYLIVQKSSQSNSGALTVCEIEAYEAVLERGLVWKIEHRSLRFYSRLETIYDTTPLKCIMICHNRGPTACDSINFQNRLRICEPNSHRNGLPTRVINDNKWNVYTAKYASVGDL